VHADTHVTARIGGEIANRAPTLVIVPGRPRTYLGGTRHRVIGSGLG
jgi:hypothetical protein